MRAGIESLTEIERKILELAVLGYTNTAIGERVHYDPIRVSVWLASIYRVLGIESNQSINKRVVATNIYLRVMFREDCSCGGAA